MENIIYQLPNDYELGEHVKEVGLDNKLISKYPNLRELGSEFRKKQHRVIVKIHKGNK